MQICLQKVQNIICVHTHLLLDAVLCGVGPETVGLAKTLDASVSLSGGAPGGLRVGDMPGDFTEVGVLGSLIAARPCVTPEIGVTG